MSKWNLKNTLTALNYAKITAIYDGQEGVVRKGGYGTDAVGRSQYVPEKPEKVTFVTFNAKARCHSSCAVEPHKIKLKVNNQIIDLESLKDDPDAYFAVHALIEQAKKQNAISAVAIAS